MTSREEVTLLVLLGKLFLCTPPILFIVNSNYTHLAQWADFPKLISCWSGDSNQQPSGHKPICDLSYCWLFPVSNQSAYPDLWPLTSTGTFVHTDVCICILFCRPDHLCMCCLLELYFFILCRQIVIQPRFFKNDTCFKTPFASLFIQMSGL